ncbi:nuclear transport factor 2 family protein [Candidatus Amarobacter glycogenicus]|uniref:nuclear transport factor 2 family protein n=1 Tax=Candidatus Amarobacter glycogenicus TaxID=3140699 RepID=UPI0031362E8A|nr:nuclear transport factor 2 family protein [Dehalococcoidia bacterium]
MTDNSPKAVVLRYYDLYNDGTPDSYGSERFLDLFADDAVIDLPEAAGLPARRGGKETLRERIAGAAAMFRNRHMAVTELVAEDERVVARTTWAASAAADSPGLPAGTRVRGEIVEFMTVRNGRIEEYSFVMGQPLAADGV